MIDRIEAWLRMRDTARFRADAERAAAGIRRIGEAADRADKKLKKLKLTNVGNASVLHALDRNLSRFSGRLRIVGALLTVFGPDLISLAASATSAAMGLGLLAATAGGAAVVGLGGFGLVLGNTLGGLEKIKTAQDAYNLALEQHGRWSDEALAAQEKLNAVVGIRGGQAVLNLLNRWNDLKKAFAGRTGSARDNALGFLFDAMDAATRIMPTFANETNKNVAAIREAMGGVFDTLASPEAMEGIRTLSRTFRGMFGPFVQGGADALVGLFAYMKQAGPWVVSIAKSFAAWAKSFRESSRDSGLVNGRVSLLIGHLQAWWGLAKALMGLMHQIWEDSNMNGGRMVRSLTNVVDRFTAWIDAGEGTDFFERWGELSARVGTALVMLFVAMGKLIDAAFPGMMSGAQGLQVVMGMFLLKLQVLTQVIQFLGPLTGPLIVAFYALRVATLAWAAATTILGIAMRLTPLGWIVTGIGLLIAAVILAWNHFDWFREGVTAVWNAIKVAFEAAWNFIKNNWKYIPAILMGPFAPVAILIISQFDKIKEAFRSVLNWIISKWNNFSIGWDPVRGPGGVVIFPGARWETPDIPMLAEGGDIMPGGMAIVGERGPEIARHEGGRTRITPLAKAAGGSPSLGGVIHIKLEAPVIIGGRQIAVATAEQTADWNARKGR